MQSYFVSYGFLCGKIWLSLLTSFLLCGMNCATAQSTSKKSHNVVMNGELIF